MDPLLNGNIFRSCDYHSIPWLNRKLASAEKCSGPLRFRLRQVLLYKNLSFKKCMVSKTQVAYLKHVQTNPSSLRIHYKNYCQLKQQKCLTKPDSKFSSDMTSNSMIFKIRPYWREWLSRESKENKSLFSLLFVHNMKERSTVNQSQRQLRISSFHLAY
jgi:hypothetical protein